MRSYGKQSSYRSCDLPDKKKKEKLNEAETVRFQEIKRFKQAKFKATEVVNLLYKTNTITDIAVIASWQCALKTPVNFFWNIYT